MDRPRLPPTAGRRLPPVADSGPGGSAGAFACWPVFLWAWPLSPGFPEGQVGGQGGWPGNPPLPEGSSILAGRDPPAGQPEGAARRVGRTPGAHCCGVTLGRTHVPWALKPQALVSQVWWAPAARLPHPRTPRHRCRFAPRALLRFHTSPVRPRRGRCLPSLRLPGQRRSRRGSPGRAGPGEPVRPVWQPWLAQAGVGVTQRPQAGKRWGAGL